MTAYHSLIEVARLQEGEKVLIHAAAGATGQLAILVAQSVGAEVFATVGCNEKKEILLRNFGIPTDHIFYSRNASFKKGIMRVTKGYGVDVVLNSLVGNGLHASLECVAPYGRFVELGKADIKANSSLPMACFANNVYFSAVDLRHIYYFRRDAGYRLITKTMELFKDGTLQCPYPLHVYPVSSIEEAFRYFQSGKNTGRIVITAGPDDTIRKCALHRRQWAFHEEATYVIVGGLGGLGRAIVSWMVSKGAKHFILLSRSGAEPKAGRQLRSGLAEQGVVVAVEKCDASFADQLSEALKKSLETMPPIRGCINAAMELNDSLFENMTFMQWEKTIRSKCHTSWNLHNLLPDDLDFFVLLSSLTSVLGNPGQSNYSAGCAFQDALARYRTYNNQKALSLNLGLMRTIGAVAENKNLHRNFKIASLRPIEETEHLALLDIYCDPSHPVLQPDKSQIAIGIMTPAEILAKNLEPDELLHRPLFASFSRSRGALQQAGVERNTNYTALFRQIESEEGKIAIVVDALARKLARALSISPDEVELDKPLYSFGVDSLVAVELKNWIRKEFAAEVAVFDIMGGTTVEMMGGIVTKASIMGRV
ncbi:KR-domain-containing protein [Lentithecium fluviatile CBS 122367]|uniref:KR-domain-containing protein n=1 Tax=Lentithecium fluviatile CBS 122367 TaxID=1168545 RepID=A0A6G1INI0_9PLEO|nr:KR-domain-containing protein [Lentithecium fluviatile CBS 122367]